MQITRCLLAGLLLFAASTASAEGGADASAMEVLGYIENARILNEPGAELRARLDTGARTSSLNALNKKRFKRDDKEWIAFDIVDPDDEDAFIRFERPVVRNVRILRHDGDHQRRPVVEMHVCVGGTSATTEVSLIDRTELTYQLLIGRRFLEERILVDSSSRLTRDPDCPKADEQDDDEANEGSDDGNGSDHDDNDEDAADDDAGNAADDD